ncbi:VOC family protein [Maribellus maritimus]|uniref:VOC family protein n=1 Tax=Maribellus maritimus TaxID=2870838 RepID=UPI001EECC60D|nr:VOC family protein [Maribellus maritimus]MCG6186163.1 VOC family protein [Maribellus maritimus]
MATVNVYLNFPGNTEEAFLFYKSVFGTEFDGQGIMRFKDVPPADGMPPIPDGVENMVMHVSLPILGGHMLMGSDAPEQMGFKVIMGTNIYINLQPDTREETRKLFKALSAGGAVEQELQDMFWGDYYGACTDKFGVKWMFNCAEKA